MIRKEIDLVLSISSEQAIRIEMHSFINVMNVISIELQLLEELVGQEFGLLDLINECKMIVKSFSNRKEIQDRISLIETFASRLNETINAVRTQFIQSDKSTDINAIFKILHIIESVLEVADVRIKELLSRAKFQAKWVEVNKTDIIQNMWQVFRTISEVSQGRYNIVFEKDQHDANNYLIEFSVHTKHAMDSIVIPPLLLDSMRDLTANSRKYSQPGTVIKTELIDNPQSIILRVADNGRGIPEDEIENVVRFGKRGSNTSSTETKGGGFGLTKAYYLCTQYNGKMRIDSGIGEGTIIQIEIPKK